MAGPSNMGGGSQTPPITVPIQSHVTNPKDISDEIFKAFQNGLLKVMQDKRMAVHMRKIFRMMGDELEKSMARAGKSIAGKITTALNKVPSAAQHAANAAGNSFNHMIPPSVQSSIDRLITHFDRLDRVIAGLGSPNKNLEHTLAQINKQISRSTTEAARQQTAAHNSALQAQAANANARAKQRVAIIQAMAGQIRALERGLGSVVKFAADIAAKAVRGIGTAFRGIASVAQASMQRAAASMRTVNAAIASVVKGVARLSTGLASGFARGFARISSALVGALRRDEGHLRSSLSRRERMVSSSASRQSSLLSRITTPQGIAAIAGGAGIGSILTGGFERFSNLERLQFQYERLLGSSTEASAMLERISNFARTTSFDLPGIAGLATNFLALGQSSDQVMTNISGLADVVAFSGGTTDSLERIQRAMGQIISTGKLQGDELNQLAENLPGINIRQIIADQLGVSTAELVKMQEAGKLDAETFINAFLTGIKDPRFEGAAEEIAKTLSGRLANLKETFDIFGASLVGLVADPLRNAMSEVTTILDRIGSFISGEMFTEQENPFAGMKPDAEIMFGDLPAEMQEILAREFGWDEENFISAGDAAGLWEQLNPPDPMMEKLRELRTMIGDFAKGAAGFLAFAGGAKLLGAALRFLVSPLTIVTSLFGLLSVFWGRLTKNSQKLRESVGRLHMGFGPLRDSLGKVGSAVLGVISNKFFGDPDFFKNVGDRVSDFVDTINDGARMFSEWLSRMARLIEIGDWAGIFASATPHILEFISGILGLTDAQEDAARALGGNDFGNIFTAFLDKLEKVPILGTIIRFVRRVVDTLSRAIGMFAGFIGDIWSSIFGGDEGPGGTLAAEFLGGDSEQKSIATRIADTLEGTFLGPVVRFFRGPFSNVVEGIGNWVGGLFNAIFRPEEGAEDDSIITRVADFLADNGLKGLIDWLRGDSLSQAYDKVVEFLAPAFSAISGAIQAASDIIVPIAQPLIEWVQKIIDAFAERDFEAFDFGKIAIGAGLGLLGGALVGGPVGGAAGALIGAMFGAGLGGAIKDSVVIAWDEYARPALQDLWGRITAWTSTVFTAENLTSAANFLLDLMYEAGRLVGNIAGDPKFTAAIVGLIGAAAAVIGNFTLGFLIGVADNVEEWGRIIATGVELAITEMGLEGVADAIGGAFENPVITAALLLAGTGLASFIISGISSGLSSLRSGRTAGSLKKGGSGGLTGAISGLAGFIFTTLGDAFKGLLTGAGGMMKMLFGKGEMGVAGSSFLSYSDKGKLQGVGKAMAAAVAVGFGAFTLGAAAGQAGGTGSLLLALLGGGISGAAIGTAILPGFGTAFGAILGTGLAALGAYLTTEKRQLDEAQLEIKEYTDALQGVAEVDWGEAAGEAFRVDLSQAELDIQEFFRMGGFNAERWADQVIAGTSDVNTAFSDLFRGIEGSDAFSKLSQEQQTALSDYIDLVDEALSKGAPMPWPESDVAADALEALGFDLDTLAQGYNLLDNEQRNLLDGLDEVERSQAMEELAKDIDTAEEAMSMLMDWFGTPLSVGNIMEASELMETLLDQEGLGTQEKIEALMGLIGEMEGQIDETKTKIGELLGTILTPPPTPETIQRDVRVRLPDMQGQVEQIEERLASGEITAEISLDLKEIAVEDFGSEVLSSLISGIEAGTITSMPQLQGIVNEMILDIQEMIASGQLDPGVGQMMIDSLAAISLSPELVALFEELANDQRVIAAARETARRLGVEWKEQFAASATATPFAAAEIFGPRGNESGTAAPTRAPDVATTMLSSIDRSDFEDNAADMAGAWGTSFVAKGPDMATDVSDTVTRSLNTAGATGVVTAASKGVLIGKAAAAGVRTGDEGMKSAGFNLAASAGRGIDLGSISAVLAAAAMARRVVNTVRAILQISSPSKVFVDIGQQVGAGFAQGVEESEGSMASAISSAITNAISTATDTVQSATAQAGAAIFGALFPSEMPGGTSALDVRGIQGSQRKQIFEFWETMQSGAAGGFGNEKGAALNTAVRGLLAAPTEAWMGFADVVDDVNDALAQRDEINAWDAAMSQLQRDFSTWTLGWRKYNEEMADNHFLLQAGLMTQEAYGDAAAELNKKLQAGILNQEAYDEALSDLGARPDILTREQINLINSGSRSLDSWTIAGRANAEVLNASLQSVQDWATAALEAGYGVKYVADGTNYWVGAMQAQAAAAGLASWQVNQLIGAMGLMPDQIAAWVASMTSLDAWTRAGEDNVAMINEQLKALRDYGVAMLEAGFAANAVAFEVGAMRNELVRQATTFGFNVNQINELIRAAGLADDQLGEFVRQMQEFSVEADRAAEAAARAKLEAEERALAATTPVGRPVVENLNVYIPYGDPEAVGMAAANAIAYRSLTAW